MKIYVELLHVDEACPDGLVMLRLASPYRINTLHTINRSDTKNSLRALCLVRALCLEPAEQEIERRRSIVG